MSDEESVLLSEEQLASCLSDISKTLDGAGYAFSRLDCHGKGLTALGPACADLKHVQFANAASNALKTLDEFAGMPALVALDARGNALEKLPDFSACSHLQVLNVEGNQLASVAGLVSPTLVYLTLSGNPLTSLEGLTGLSVLKRVEVKGCGLTSFAGLGDLPALSELIAEGNALESLAGLDAAVGLKTLSLRGNSGIVALVSEEGSPSWASFEALDTLDLSGTGLESAAALEPLKECPSLKHLSVAESPFGEGDAPRVEILLMFPALESIDGTPVSSDDRMAAKEEAERRRQEAEEAAAAAAAAEEEEED
jgi:Leucine-rich repeat (LRR) protein